MNIKITADSTCDLPSSLLEQYDITLAPLTVLVDNQVFHDGVDITPDDIFAACREGKTVKTTAVNLYEYQTLFRSCLKEHDAVLHLCIGSRFSACYANACQAASGFKNVYVVDTANLSSGSGHLVLDAAEMAADGMTPETIIETLKREIPCVDASFVVKQIDYLYRGGRCSGVEATGAKLLNIKPSIEVLDGKMVVGKKYRGSVERCLEHYIKDKLVDRGQIDFSRVFITYSPCEPGVTEFVRQVLSQHANFLHVIESNASSTIATHCGPSTLGVMFKRKMPKTPA